MKTIHKLLCPVDCSEPSVSALGLAAELAQLFQAELIILNVIESFSSKKNSVPRDTSAEASQVNERKLEAYCELMGLIAAETPADIHVSAEVVFGHPANEIIGRAAKGVDLIVMSTHGRTGFKHLIHGSVTNKVLRSAPCPVMAIPWNGPFQSTEVTRPALHGLITDGHQAEKAGAARVTDPSYSNCRRQG